VRDRAPERLAAAVALLAASAAVVILVGARRGGAETARSSAFQHAIGGLGSGGATSLAPCDAAFDAGVAGACESGFDPVAGGRAFCKHHSGPTIGR
jgi:hypothetical protein